MRSALSFGVLVVTLGACAKGSADRTTPPQAPEAKITAVSSGTREPLLPEAPSGSLAPSLTRLVGDSPPHLGQTVSDVEVCASCHSDVASHWRKSAHAFASFNNPVYRVVVDKIRAERGDKTSQFCGGCHDVSLLVDGAMLAPIEGSDLRAHAGITCVTCHSIADVRADGNASYDLDVSAIPMPKDGDPESVLRHRARVGRATLRTSALCEGCHKAFLDTDTGNQAHLVGQDDATPWARSAFAGSHSARVDDEVKETDCRGCHMPRVPAVLGDPGAKHGTVASHWFLGGHTWLASMQNDPELVDQAQRFMKGRVSLDVAGVRHGDGRHELASTKPIVVSAGESTAIDVVIRNLDVGHRFPGGVMDAQDTWLEVTVDDARGKRVAEAGLEHEATGADPTAHTLSSYMARADGTRLMVRETHEFRAGVYNNTIAPRDATVVGFGFLAPGEGAAYPLRANVRLRHRSRNLPLQRAACADTRGERGRLFGRVGLTKVARAIDACRPQPITELASASLLISSGDKSTSALPEGEPREVTFRRLFAYGLGLSHALQERLDDARLPLMGALELAASPRERAMALGAIAQVAEKQGRTDETFAVAERADSAAKEAGMPPQPAMQRARAEVLASTWRLSEASPFFLDVARSTPRDDGAWAAAAMTLGGAGDALGALDAARHGLASQPRDGDMLRVQALSLSTLHADARTVKNAESAFLERRSPDDAPGVRAQCSAKIPGCANERVPVHIHVMRQLM